MTAAAGDGPCCQHFLAQTVIAAFRNTCNVTRPLPTLQTASRASHDSRTAAHLRSSLAVISEEGGQSRLFRCRDRPTLFRTRGQQSSSSFTVPKSIDVSDVIVVPAGTFWVQTFQLRSETCIRCAPVASCEVVTEIP